MPARYPAVVAYDISQNKARRRVHRILQDWRIDGQYSVAECVLSYAEAEELFVQLNEQIDPDTDRIAIAWLFQPMRVRTIGRAIRSFPNGLMRR